jgi:quinol monooxygenase YgiN
MTVYLISTNRLKPGTENRVREAAALCRAETLKEPGCLSYDLNQSTSDPLVFTFVERWKTREDITTHMATPHLLAWRAVAVDCVETRQIEIIHPDRVEAL